jgi:hypothetical protein
MRCDDVRNLLEEYALGILDEDDLAAVEAHLAWCDACRALAAEYRELLTGLPDALALASPVRLPDVLKQHLLRAIGADIAERERVSPPRSRGRATLRRVLVLAAAVVLVLSVAATAALSLALDRERRLNNRFAGLLDQREVVIEVIDGRGTERAFLRSQDESLDAYGKLFTNPRLRQVVVMTGRLPKVGDDEVYRVWLTGAGTTSAAGVLKVNQKGFGLLVFKASGPGPRYDAARIVRQRADATMPRGETVLAWDGQS